MAEDLNDAASKFASILRGAAKEGVDSSKPTNITVLTLTGIHPTKLQKGKLIIPNSYVIMPASMGFDKDDVGKSFLFLKTDSGAKYVFMAELGAKK